MFYRWHHPQQVCMSYYKHFCFSFKLSKLFLVASFKAVCHALFPDIFITSSSDTVNNIKYLIDNSGCLND